MQKPEVRPKGSNIISPNSLSIKINMNSALGRGLDWSHLVHGPIVGLYRVNPKSLYNFTTNVATDSLLMSQTPRS